MPWIATSPITPDLAALLAETLVDYPDEYKPVRGGELELPDAVKNESIVMTHSLIPRVMKHVFLGYAAMLDPGLPLSRRQHELIAAMVSSVNRCFY